MKTLLAAVLALALSPVAVGQTLVIIDTRAQDLRVVEAGEEVLYLPRIALGRGGTSMQRERGDRTTPLGSFRVAWINEESRFHLFFGLDFPNFDHASRAYDAGELPLDEFLAVTDALRERRLPPQETGLGGSIGIHGVGDADPDIHRRLNWTRGCVAVTDEEMEALAEYVDIGTRVVITENAPARASAASR